MPSEPVHPPDRRPRVLVSAFAFAPGTGSEPGAGWDCAVAASEVADVVVLTRAANMPAVEAERDRADGLPFEVRPVQLRIAGRPLPWTPARGWTFYVLWQLAARRAARAIIAEADIDIVHHVSYSTSWQVAGVLFADRTTPTVWGPVGGGSTLPLAGWRWLGPRAVLAELVRQLGVSVANSTVARLNARRATVTIASNAEIAGRLRSSARHPVEVAPNQAVDVAAPRAVPPTGGPARRRAVFAGRLIPTKGVAIVIEALAHEAGRGWDLTVVGDGPDRVRLEALARRQGVADRVTFVGQLPQAEAWSHVAGGDAFVFPSLREGAPWAPTEAAALGVPVVALDVPGTRDVLEPYPAVVMVPARGNLARRLAVALRDLPTSSSTPEPVSGTPLSATFQAAYRQACSSSPATSSLA